MVFYLMFVAGRGVLVGLSSFCQGRVDRKAWPERRAEREFSFFCVLGLLFIGGFGLIEV